ncbi:MAG: hypothetical protein DYH14_09470 [Betaproteobacteria bacterium PRO3]|nr:hypothetical protein [Betaproteobacteria bacterium PRO3]
MVPCPREPDDRPALARPGAAIARSLIDSELARVAESRAFRASRRHQRFLRHLVERAVDGNHGALKEPVLALEVFDRTIDAFDPGRDTIVRVEARRLRQRLERYYADEGEDALIEFRLPVGSYVPTLHWRVSPDDGGTRAAKDLVERGEHFLRQPLSRPTLESALERFEAALRESPHYAPALVGLGRAWFNLAAGWYHEPGPASEHASEALRAALDVDPSSAVAHALLGAIQHQFEYDWPAAQESFDRAIALAPRRARALARTAARSAIRERAHAHGQPAHRAGASRRCASRTRGHARHRTGQRAGRRARCGDRDGARRCAGRVEAL